jgi:hypothetical protein
MQVELAACKDTSKLDPGAPPTSPNLVTIEHAYLDMKNLQGAAAAAAAATAAASFA